MHSGFRSGLDRRSGVRVLGCADSLLESAIMMMASACLESFVQITMITLQDPGSVVYVKVDADLIACQCHEFDRFLSISKPMVLIKTSRRPGFHFVVEGRHPRGYSRKPRLPRDSSLAMNAVGPRGGFSARLAVELDLVRFHHLLDRRADSDVAEAHVDA
jgi:hypothetical protein